MGKGAFMKDRIKKLRKELDMTQQKLANRLGVQRNTIAMYEMGRTTPSDAIILSICREFNVNERWLRDGTGEMFLPMDAEDELMQWAGRVLSGRDSSFKKRFVAMLSKLSEAEWELLEQRVKELAAGEERPGDLS